MSFRPLPVRPLQVHTLPVRRLLVRPLQVRPPPVADTLGGLFCGGMQSSDNHNPPAKWVVKSWQIWHHHATYVAKCVRYHNDHEDTILILDFRWSHRTIRGPKLQDVSLLGQPGARYIGLLNKSVGLPRSLPREKLVSIERDEDVSTSLKLTSDEDIPNPVLLVLPQAPPNADPDRLLASVRWILC